MSGSTEVIEITLHAPLLFDQSIGYWTGDPDEAALSRALATVDPHPEVARTVFAGGVALQGPEGPAREQARLLREAGLE